MSLANYFSKPFWSAFDLKSDLSNNMHSLFSLLLISKLLIQKHVLLLLGSVFGYSRFFFGLDFLWWFFID